MRANAPKIESMSCVKRVNGMRKEKREERGMEKEERGVEGEEREQRGME